MSMVIEMGWTPETFPNHGPSALMRCQFREAIATFNLQGAELYALDTGSRQHDVYRQLFFKMTDFVQARVLAFTDSQVIIAQVDKGDLSTKTKHLRLAFQAVLERVTDNGIMLQHVPGTENPADLFTKPLPKSEFAKHVATILNDNKFPDLEWISCFYDRS